MYHFTPFFGQHFSGLSLIGNREPPPLMVVWSGYLLPKRELGWNIPGAWRVLCRD